MSCGKKTDRKLGQSYTSKIYFINISRGIFKKIYTVIAMLEMYLSDPQVTQGTK